MPITHKKVNRTKKVVCKGKKMSGGSRKVTNRTKKVAPRSWKMVGGGKTPKTPRTKVGRDVGPRRMHAYTGRNGRFKPNSIRSTFSSFSKQVSSYIQRRKAKAVEAKQFKADHRYMSNQIAKDTKRLQAIQKKDTQTQKKLNKYSKLAQSKKGTHRIRGEQFFEGQKKMAKSKMTTQLKESKLGEGSLHRARVRYIDAKKTGKNITLKQTILKNKFLKEGIALRPKDLDSLALS